MTTDSPSWVPDACTLPTAEQPLRDADFAEFLASRVIGVRRLDEWRLRLDLEPGAATAARAADLAARETACCSFFTFTLTITGGRQIFEVSTEEAHTQVLDALSTRAASALSRTPGER